MAADCYVHQTVSGGIPNRVGSAPLGACKICGSFACAMHGARQPSHPRFVCVLCVPSLLVAGALESEDLPEEFRELGPDLPDGVHGIRTLEEFREDLPEFAWAIEDAQRRLSSVGLLFTSGDTERFWFAIPLESQGLVLTAVVFAYRLNIPRRELPPVLRPFVREYRPGS